MTIALRDNLVRDDRQTRVARLLASLRGFAGRFALPVAIGGIVAGFFLVAVALVQWVHDATQIDTVRVEGSFRPGTQAAIARSMSSLVAGHSLIGVPVDEIVHELAALSWVSQVDVYRVWPHGLVVRITEKVPVAHWNGDGYISHTGEVFQPENAASVVSDLPQLAGPADKAAQVMAFYSVANAMLMPYGLAVKELRLNAQLSWEIVLGNGIRLRLDQEDGQARLRRFLGVYGERLKPVAARIESVDLRYIGGFAVRWQPAGASTATGAAAAQATVTQATATQATVTQAGATAPGGEHGANGQ